MEQKRGMGFVLELTIILVFGLIVVVTIMFFLGEASWLLSLPFIPDFLIANSSENEVPPEFECPRIIGKIEKTFGKDYLKVNGKETRLYLHNENEIWLNPSNDWSDKQIGGINQGVVSIFETFMNEKSQEFLDYSDEGLLRVKDIKMLHDSFRVRNYLCRSREQIADEKKCVENCTVIRGICSSKIIENKISIGELDCDLQKCYVDETEEILENNGLVIKSLEDKGENILEKDKLDLVLGSKGLQTIKFSLESQNEFCYVLRTNNEVLQEGSTKGLFSPDISEAWIPSVGDKLIELHAWDINDDKKRVVKRIKVSGKISSLIVMPIEEENAYKRISQANVGSIFLITGIRFDWSQKGGTTLSTADYKLEKIAEDKVEILVYDVYPDEKEWHVLDCVFDAHFFGSGDDKYLEINKLKQGFRKALVEDCSWN